MKKVRIEAGSRLHFALMDMTGDMGRVDGGIGLALKNPRIVIEAEIHKGISSDAQAPLVEATIQKLRERYELDSGTKVHVIDSYPAHVGLGSSTQFILSVATAYMRLNNRKVGARELAGLLGRGGTSGIGVAAFEVGGFLMDGGHSFGPGQEKTSFLPSRASESLPAPLLLRNDFPENWTVDLLLPHVEPGLSGQAEIDFFTEHCPVDPAETGSIARIVTSLILPAVTNSQIATFARGINLLATLGFKKAEIEAQDPIVGEMLQNLRHITQMRAAIGMSSFGPVLYIIWDEVERDKHLNNVENCVLSYQESVAVDHYMSCGRNEGRHLIVERS